jgi:RNA polymerase sigma-70 factor (ECF subfamily)
MQFPMRQSDRQLVRATLAGRTEAFGLLVERHLPAVQAVALARLGNRADAEDVVQEAFIKAYRALHELRDGDRFRGWIAAIARRLCATFVRTRRPSIPLEEAPEIPAPETRPELRELHEILRQRIMEMDKSDREALLLYYFSGLKIREVAETLGISPAAAAKRIERARDALGRRLVDELGATFGPDRPDRRQVSAIVAAVAEIEPAWKAGAVIGVATAGGWAAKIIAATVVVLAAGAVVVWSGSQREAKPTVPEDGPAAIASPRPTRLAEAAVAEAPPQPDEAPTEAVPQQTAAEAEPFDYFLYGRPREGNPSGEGTFVLADARASDFTPREVGTFRQWDQLLDVVNGKAWLLSRDALVALDLATRTRKRVALPPSAAGSFQAGRFHAALRRDETVVHRLYDLRLEAYRDLPGPSPSYNSDDCLLSPDGERVAWMEPQRVNQPGQPAAFNASALTIIIMDLATGETRSAGPFRWVESPLSSRMGGPPFAWLDADTLLTIRTQGLAETGPSPGVTILGDGKISRQLVEVDARSGDVREGPTIPGSTMDIIRLRPAERGEPLRLQAGQLEYTYSKGKLVEYEGVAGFRVVEQKGRQELQFQGKRLFPEESAEAQGQASRAIVGGAGSEYGEQLGSLSVSPDGRRATWMVQSPMTNEAVLYLYDKEEGSTRRVGPCVNDASMLWVKASALTSAAPPPLPEGWHRIEYGPDVEPARKGRDTRLSAPDYLLLTVTSDKPAYRLHEPVRLTFSLTNVSNVAVQAPRPLPRWPLVEGRLDTDSGSTGALFERYFDDTPIQELAPPVDLAPGETLTEEDVIEVGRAETYALSVEYGPQDGWKGRCRAETTWTVEPSADDAALLSAKMERLLGRLREEALRQGLVSGRHPAASAAADDLAAMGAEAAPFLMQAIREETDDTVLAYLYSPLIRHPRPDMLGFLAERFGRGSVVEQTRIISGLAELAAKGPVAQAAGDLLLKGMEYPDPAVRRQTAGALAPTEHPGVAKAFESALRDDDPIVRGIVSMWLAGREGLALDKWLRKAADAPSELRYEAARHVVRRLEEHWHEDHGKLPEQPWTDAAKNPAALGQYAAVLRSWAERLADQRKYCAEFFQQPKW